jgi:chemotaxis protein MotA
MMLIVGAILVLAAVAGGYMMEGGKLLLLSQPSEFIIIVGAAVGTLLVSTPMVVLRQIGAQVVRLLRPSPSRADFGELLGLQYAIFRIVQQSGVMALESHFEDPSKSPVLSKHPKLLARHDTLAFLSDSIKVIIVGGISPHDFELLMTEDLEMRHKDALLPSQALAKIGDALPGFGIVAAVLGVVLTMQAIDGPPAEIGHKVGAALVGTFLGILLAYGFVGPLATSLEHRVNDESNYDQCIKAGLLAVYKGCVPAIAVEFARRVIPEEVRPSFEETEKICRSTRTTEAKAA